MSSPRKADAHKIQFAVRETAHHHRQRIFMNALLRQPDDSHAAHYGKSAAGLIPRRKESRFLSLRGEIVLEERSSPVEETRRKFAQDFKEGAVRLVREQVSRSRGLPASSESRKARWTTGSTMAGDYGKLQALQQDPSCGACGMPLADGAARVTDRVLRTVVPQPIAGAVLRVARLSPRERAVFELLGLGYDNRSLARALGMSERTAKRHVTAILAKLELESRLQAGLTAMLVLAATARDGQWPKGRMDSAAVVRCDHGVDSA
jgi:DNA-binding CsgD family transcriptional regulator